MMADPRRIRPRVLLTSVFGPFTRDDEFGSRAINPLELYHNQVTRAQGPFSLRMHHRSWGIMLIQANISAPSTLLDFPTRERFIDELRTQQYDIVGISGIVVNIGKVREMCRLVRLHSPGSTLVVGGHVAAIPGVERMLDADHIVTGEGIRWFRAFLGERVDAPIVHPPIRSSFGFRLMGLRAPSGGGDPAATIIPSVGCPMGCDFCTTSMFVFSSANAIRKYEMRQLVELGVTWVWMGFESAQTGYAKLKGIDTIALTRELQSHGIRVQGSTIIGMEQHTPANMREEIEHAVAHDADCHQFMLYTPVPGTPLHTRMQAEGRMLAGVDFADIHGQYKFNFTHPHIDRDDSKSWLDRAFERDFDVNGPSLFRMMRTMFRGWTCYRHDGDPRIRARF